MEIWRMDVEQWRSIACRAAGRNMTTEEWNQLGPGRSGSTYEVTCPQWPAAQA
ncbi:MAG TPA: hypothetical protein VF855_07945 [Acidimicrobiales bacterium]